MSAGVDIHPDKVHGELRRRTAQGRIEAGHTHVPVESFVSDDYHIMVLRTGDLLAFYETEGIDPVCLSEDEIIKHANTLTQAYNEMDSRLCVHTYFIKDRAYPSKEELEYVDPIVSAIDGARTEALKGQKYFGTRIVYGFEWKSSFSGGQSRLASVMPLLLKGMKGALNAEARSAFAKDLRMVLGGEQSVRVAERKLIEEIAEFQSAMAALVSKMEQLSLGSDVDASLAEAVGATRLEFIPLKGFEAFKVLHRLWNWDEFTRDHPFLPGPSEEIAPWVVQSNLDFRMPSTFYSGEKPIRIYSVRGFRDPVEWDVLSHIRSIPTEMVIHTRFALMGTDQSSAFVAKRIGKAHNLGGFSKGDPLKVKRIEDMKLALKESVRGKPFGRWACQIAIASDDREHVEDVARRLEGICAGRGIGLRREELSKDYTFYAMIPGNTHYEFMTRMVQSMMSASVQMPYRQSEGRGTTPPRDSPFPEALCSINTYDPATQKPGLPVNWWLSVGNLAHFALIGKSGGGKSFLVCSIASNFGRYAGTKEAPVGLKRWIIDKGHSYRSLCSLLNGSYINVADPDTKAVMNPFDLPPEELKREIPNLVKLLGLMMAASSTVKVELGESDASALSEGLRGMVRHLEATYEFGEFGSIELLNTFLHGVPRLQDRLKDWLESGIYAHIFPAERDGMGQADTTVFNFEAQFVPDNILGPVFFYILNRINMAVESEELKDWRKFCFIDETAAFITPKRGDWKSELVTSEIRAFIRIAFKTWRKKNGTLGLASQEASDFQGDPEFWQTFRGQVPTKMFLAQKDCGDALTHPREGLGIPMHLVDIIQRLPRGAFLIDSGGMRRYLMLIADPTSYAIYTTDPVESNFRSWWLSTHPYSGDYAPLHAFEDIGKHIAAAKKSGAPEAYYRHIQRQFEGKE